MGDSPSTEKSASVLRSYIQYLPDLLRVTALQQPYIDQVNFNSRANISPRENALNLDMYKQFGPQFNSVGQDIARSNALSQAETDRLLTANIGPDVIRNLSALQRELDPEWYANREMASAKLLDSLAGQDPNKLSGSELAETERGLNRVNTGMGVAGVGSPTAAIANAGAFGSALDKKRKTLNDTLSTFAAVNPASQSKIDAFQVTTGKPATSAFGQSNFKGSTPNGDQAFGMGSNWLSTVNNQVTTAANNNAQLPSTFDYITSGLNSLSSAA